MASLYVSVVSPDKVVFEGDASALVAPAWDGQVGVLPGHAPMLALIGSGVLTVDRPGGGSDSFHVAGGVLKVERDTVTLLTEYAGDEPPFLNPLSAGAERSVYSDYTRTGASDLRRVDRRLRRYRKDRDGLSRTVHNGSNQN